MLAWNLTSDGIKFLKHKVEYDIVRKTRNENREIVEDIEKRSNTFYDTETKDACLQRLGERNIEYTVTDYDEPSSELLTKVEGKKFNTVAEAKAFIDGAYKPVEDRLNDIELALLESEGII